MSILTEPRKPTESPMWLRDMTDEDFIAVARERFIREVESGMRTVKCEVPSDKALPQQ